MGGTFVFLGVILLVFALLDGVMMVSLLRPGDERNQVIVWKASAFTLFSMAGLEALTVVENLVKVQPMTANPLIHLETAAILYFIALIYHKKRHGG